MCRTLVSLYSYRWIRCAFSGIVAVSVAGCVGPYATTTKNADPAVATHDAHEHFPEHWPYTIFAASQRLSELVQAPNTPSSHHAIPPSQEFSDLVSWLPILAADSDLDREVFDRIDTWSREQSAILSKFDPQTIVLADVVADEQVQNTLRWLSGTCQAEQQRLDQLLQ